MDNGTTVLLDPNILQKAGLSVNAETPSVLPILKFAARTDMGVVRENNEDKFDFFEPEDLEVLQRRGCLYAVSDGMGGAAAGQIASEQTLNMLVDAYYNYYNSVAPDGSPIDVPSALRNAILVANGVVKNYALQHPERKGMGATLTCLVFHGDHVYAAQVGDSRAYLIRGGNIRQVTKDHSWVEEQVRAGILTREEAEISPYRNVITRSVGTQNSVEPEMFAENIQDGDIWVLCSDGLTTYLEDKEIARIVQVKCPSEATLDMVRFARERGGKDNITAMVLAVRGLAPLTAVVASP